MVQTAHAEALRTQRSLIARELHDTLARANTRVYLRAQGALSASAEQPEVAALLEEIAETSRSSVTELRAMLRVLREDAPAQPDTAPATDLGAAFSSARSTLRRAGLRVTTTHNGRLTELPATVAATLVLAIDEAVTCLRTCAATDTRSQLVLDVGRSRADLLAMCRIADRHSPHDHELTDRAGLLGLGERAHALEGTFDCAIVGRQWLLTLSLPLAAKKSPSAT
ncbi:sensor histidine kinase [Actinomyces sp. oral taxon 897]|uniref:sensor histidine kinase n=1 Tax=Actinomyces sp. oral taxon 897 TaxID=2081702 RepID=UPI0013ED8661|nr:histidine kinase [Actinomyces sp. oral taxon 897]